MIVGYHIIYGAYGFWLPNDPRGSWSEFVGSWELLRFGPATKTMQRRSLAHRPHDGAARLEAKKSLKYPAVTFTGLQARAIGRGFARYAQRSGLPIWACAILPDHVHLVVGATAMSVEQLVIQLKGTATESLTADGIHPLAQWMLSNGRAPKCFARSCWKVFLDPPDVPRAIDYVRRNPEKEGKKTQRWSFVTSPG